MAFKIVFLVPLLTFTISNVVSEVMLGAPTAQHPNMEIAWKAANKINGARNSIYMMVPIKVVKAQSQVVAGVKQNMDILYGDSTCTKRVELSAVDLASCKLMPNGHRELYNVQLYSRPWENYEELTVTKLRDVAPGEKI